MAIEIVDLPIKNSDFPVRYVKLPESNLLTSSLHENNQNLRYPRPAQQRQACDFKVHVAQMSLGVPGGGWWLVVRHPKNG